MKQSPAITSTICRQPMYQQIAASLRQQILQQMQKGDRLPNEHELAERFNVSLITIKGALNILANEGLVVRQRGRGTHVNIEAVKEGKDALLIELDIKNYDLPYYQAIVDHILEEARAQGIEMELYVGSLVPGSQPVEITCKRFIKDLRAGHLRGIISIGTSFFIPWRDEVLEQKLPIVGSGVGCPRSVSWNFHSLIDIGLHHLVAQGCKRIAGIGWSGFDNEHDSIRRYFFNACRAYGLPTDELLFRADLHPLWQGSGWEEFRELWLGSEQRPDGLLIIDGEVLSGVIEAIDELPAHSVKSLEIVTAAFPWGVIPERENLHFRHLLIEPQIYAREMVKLYLEASAAVGSSRNAFYPPIYLPLRLASHARPLSKADLRENALGKALA